MLTRLSLRHRLLFSLLLVASVSIVSATLFSIRYFSGKMSAEVSQNMQIKARVAESIVQRSMSDLQTFTKTLAIDQPLRLMIVHHLTAKISDYLLEKVYKLNAHIAVFDESRQEIARVVNGLEIPRLSQKNFLFAHALHSGQTLLSLRRAVLPESSEPLLMISATMPILSKDGQTVGAVLVEHALNDDRELIERIEELLNVTAVIYVDGAAISFGRVNTIEPSIADALISGRETHYEVREMELGGEVAEYIPLYDHAHTPVAILGISQPADAYVQTRNEAITKLLFIMLGCLLLALVLGVALARSFLEPIRQLSNGVQQISAGDLQYTIRLDSRDELGTLAGAFNSMASQLHSSFGKIREQMQEIEQSSEEREALVVQLQDQNTVLQREIAERKRTEEERQSLEIQLRQIHKLEALGTLAGGVAHDFNNILAIILMHAEILFDAAQDETSRKSLQRILQAGERGANLVRQILAFSVVEEHERVPIGIGPILQESLKMLRATMSTTIDIQHDIQPDCPLILADATQIHQIIVNLCMNAGQAMKERGGVLQVILRTVNYAQPQDALFAFDDAREHVMLEIADSGDGIPSEIQERIFEPFFTTKAVGQGSGLGLSVVHGIVKAHKGTIEVQSFPGKGTRVQVFFPVAARQGHGRAREQLVSDASNKVQGAVLIVDDETDLLTLYTMQLEELGYRVTSVNDGERALEQFQQNPQHFDLVLTDHSMPGMNGMELGEELLKLHPELPIILITGYSEVHIAEEAYGKGIRFVLNKPMRMDVLRRTILEAMRKDGEP